MSKYSESEIPPRLNECHQGNPLCGMHVQEKQLRALALWGLSVARMRTKTKYSEVQLGNEDALGNEDNRENLP